MNAVSRIVGEALKAIQVALLAIAVVAIVHPPSRTPALHACLVGLLFVECASTTWRGWRRGLLTKTAAQLHDEFKARGRITTGPLEQASILAGVAATFVFLL